MCDSSSKSFARRMVFSIGTRAFILRATLLSLVIPIFYVLMVMKFVWEEFSIVVSSFGGIALLQILSAFKTKLVWGIVDLVLVLAETGTMGFVISWPILRDSDLNSAPLATQITCCVLVLATAILICLQLSWRIATTFMTDGKKNLLMPFDLQIGAPPSQQQTSMDLLMGTFIWRRIFTRESRLIRIFRGCSAIILFAIFIVFAFTSIVFRPLSGQGMGIRVKTYRTRKLDSSITGQLPLDPMWSVFVAVYYDNSLKEFPDYAEHDAPVKVNQQYINKTGFPGASSLACGRLDAVIQSSAIRTAYSLAQYPAPLIYGFSCPGNYIFNLGLRRDSPAPFYYDAMDTPDLLVTVNFTALDLLPSSNNTVPGFRKSPDSVSVFVGTINDIVDVFDNTQAAVLMPGQHLMSGMDAHIRQRFARNGAATFGIASLSKMRTFLVADLVGLMPNPSTDIARENNTASLYLYMYPHRVSEWTIVADTQEDTILNGLSLVGGFWTFANGLVAFFFGSRLVLIFFGNKPISPFGLIHRFRRVELTDSYPRLISDDGGSAAERGLAAFLRDHVVDLGSVNVSNTKNVAGTDNTEMEPLPMLCRSDTEKEEASLYSRANDNSPTTKLK